MNMELIDTISVHNTLGEGVTWDPRTGCVLWTDIHEMKLHRLHFETRKHECFELPDRLSSFGLTEDENILICAFSFGFAFYNVQTQSVSEEKHIEDQWPGIRMNDGRLDPQGRFWAGSMVEDHDLAPPHGASLFSIEGGRVKKHLSDVEISNGLAWSLDGRHMFFTDTPTQKIYRYDYNQDDGSFSNKSLFVELPSGAFPDGSIVDQGDYLWNAQWGAAKVVRYSSKGHEDYELKLPVSQPTCLTFGGEDMNMIFITTAREGLPGAQLENEPEAGNLFIYKSNVTGLKSNQFYKLAGNETNE